MDQDVDNGYRSLSFLQALWSYSLETFPNWYLVSMIPLYIFILVYWGFGLSMLIIDFVPSMKQKWWHFKFQRREKDIPSWEMVLEICFNVGVQQLTIYPIIMLVGSPLLLNRLSFDEKLEPNSK